MTNQEIFDLVACFDRSTAQTMRLSTQEFTIELTRGGAAAPQSAAPASAATGRKNSSISCKGLICMPCSFFFFCALRTAERIARI